MTGPAETPGTLFNLLALYAALDKAVLGSGDPNVAATVEGFLPGTTGENQRGWSVALEQFLGRGFPDVNTALFNITNAPPPTRPQLSRLVYVLGSLLHLPSSRVEFDPGLLVEGFSLAQPQSAPVPGRTPLVTYFRGGTDPGQELLLLVSRQFKKRQDWIPATTDAVLRNCLDDVVASVPLCNACLTTQGGIECVLVDTRFSSVSVVIDQVKAILDLRNWAGTAGDFFCEMKGLGIRQAAPFQGWGRVLETVSPSCGVMPNLKTQLVYYKADYPGQAVLQYDLDDTAPNQGDGYVTVDKGWLKVATGTSTNRNAGVTVNTRKVVHIRSLPPVAQKIFVCVMGYGQASVEMLLGAAIHPPPQTIAWSTAPAPLDDTQGEQQLTASAVGAEAVQPDPASAASGSGASAPARGSGAAPTTAAGLAVSMLSDYLAEVTNEGAEIVAKYANADLTVDDLVKSSAKFGARMASEPWKFVQKLSELPPRPPTGGPTQGGANP